MYKRQDFVVGYIEKNSFDMGGQKPESAKIEAEQVPGTPVLIIPIESESSCFLYFRRRPVNGCGWKERYPLVKCLP